MRFVNISFGILHIALTWPVAPSRLAGSTDYEGVVALSSLAPNIVCQRSSYPEISIPTGIRYQVVSTNSTRRKAESPRLNDK
ncbi:hypothetical protein BDF22DRAFT_669178 [Syncephalis plumigaleata]|nr:hypothetical protein BDF22DRAFT_669178 [Syncephalis plumigaleata]